MKRLMTVATLFVCAAAQADVYYAGAGATKTDFVTALKWYADAARTILVEKNPTQANTDTWVFTSTGSKIGGHAILAEGGDYRWGDDGTYLGKATTYSQNCNAITFNVPSCTVFGCSISADYGSLLKFLGTYEFIYASGLSFSFKANVTAAPHAQGKSNHADIEFAGKFIGAENIHLQCTSTISASYSAKTILSGDFSAFKGWLSVNEPAGTNNVMLTAPTALGSPDWPRDNALVLRANTKLVIGPEVNQAVGRGVTFELAEGKVAFLGTPDSGVSTISVPLNGDVGTLAKIDGGSLTLAGRVAMRNLEVREGELILADTATLAEGTTINVAKGAALWYDATQIGKFTLTGEGVHGLVPKVVTYDPAAEPPVVPVALPEGFDPKGELVAVRLSQPIALPVHEELLLPIFTIPNGTRDASDFMDITEKVNDLPRTSFVLETRDGVQTVSLRVNRAVAVQVTKAQENDAATYSDGKPKHDDGTDYYTPYGLTQMRTGTGSNIGSWGLDNGVFVLGYNCSVFDYCSNLHMGDLRVHGGCTISTVRAANKPNNNDRNITGKITLEDDCTEAKPAVFQFNSTQFPNEMSAKLCGGGAIQIKSNEPNLSPETPLVVRLTGDNRAYSGQIRYVASGAAHYMVLSITNAWALGGANVAFDSDAIHFDCDPKKATDPRTVTLRVENTLTVDDPNRGWWVTSGNLRQPEGVTFTLNSPLTIVTELAKDGAGTLALGGSVSGSALSVNEGFVEPVNGTSFAGLDVTFAEGTGIAIDLETADEDVRAKGLVAKSMAIPETGLRVELRNWREKGVAKSAILTVPEATDDLTGKLQLIGQSAIKELTKETKDGATTYFATYSRSGLTLVVQ